MQPERTRSAPSPWVAPRDKQELTERAARTWENLRGGLFSHGAVADQVDALVYGVGGDVKPPA